MCPALEELMKDVIDERVDSAVDSAVDEIKLTDIRNIMDSFGVSAEQAMDALKTPNSKRVFYLSKL